MSLDPETRERLDDSNISPSARAAQEAVIEEGCREEGVQPSMVFAWTMADLYRKEDGSSMGSDHFLMGVLPGIGLMLFKEKGGFLRARRVDVQSMLFSDLPGLRFWAEDKQHGRNWGSFDLQGVTSGGMPILRLGWSWSSRDMSEALQERERIASMLPT